MSTGGDVQPEKVSARLHFGCNPRSTYVRNRRLQCALANEQERDAVVVVVVVVVVCLPTPPRRERTPHRIPKPSL